MRVFVLGAGAIGSIYGAKLSKHHDVTLIGRPVHVDAIRQHGLVLHGLEEATLALDAAARVDAIPPGSLILLTTKVNDTEAAIEPLVPLLSPGVTILCVQNGLYSETLVRNLVGGRAVVLRAITQFGAILTRPGVVNYTVAGYTLVEQHERAAGIAGILTEAGLDGRVTPTIKQEMWRKLIFNCVINPITSIVGCEVGGIVDRRLDPLKQLVIDECLAVARADGVEFDVDFMRLITDVFGPSRNTASMRQDLMKGRGTEIDYMNGAVAALGARYGIDCPVNAGLTSIIRYLEERSRSSDVPPQGLQTMSGSIS